VAFLAAILFILCSSITQQPCEPQIASAR